MQYWECPCEASAVSKRVKQVRRRGKKKGGGGPWRAYVRLHTLGSSNPTPLSELALGYRAIRTAGGHDYQELQRAGRVASVVAKLADRRLKTSFGIWTRRLAQCRRQALHRALHTQWKGLLLPDKAQQVIHYADARGGDIGLAVQIAKGVEKVRALQKQDELAAQYACLKSFGAKRASDSQFLQQNLPALAGLGVLTPCPCPTAMCFRVDPQPCADAGVQGCAYACAHRKSNLSTSLQQDWEDKHKVIEERQCDPIGPTQEGKGACLLAGVCICSGEGKRLRQFRSRVMQTVRRVFIQEVRSGLRQKLSNGSVCLMLNSGAQQLWLHISMMYYKPVRPTFHILEPVPFNEPLYGVSGQRRTLQAAHWQSSLLLA